jgi:hypothetical protein
VKGHKVLNSRGDLTQRHSSVTLKDIKEKEEILQAFNGKNILPKKNKNIIIPLTAILDNSEAVN